MLVGCEGRCWLDRFYFRRPIQISFFTDGTRQRIARLIVLVTSNSTLTDVFNMLCQDKDGKFRLILVESRIHRLARYYKAKKVLPPVWK